jgi:hypothetical protein
VIVNNCIKSTAFTISSQLDRLKRQNKSAEFNQNIYNYPYYGVIAR